MALKKDQKKAIRRQKLKDAGLLPMAKSSSSRHFPVLGLLCVIPIVLAIGIFVIFRKNFTYSNLSDWIQPSSRATLYINLRKTIQPEYQQWWWGNDHTLGWMQYIDQSLHRYLGIPWQDPILAGKEFVWAWDGITNNWFVVMSGDTQDRAQWLKTWHPYQSQEQWSDDAVVYQLENTCVVVIGFEAGFSPDCPTLRRAFEQRREAEKDTKDNKYSQEMASFSFDSAMWTRIKQQLPLQNRWIELAPDFSVSQFWQGRMRAEKSSFAVELWPKKNIHPDSPVASKLSLLENELFAIKLSSLGTFLNSDREMNAIGLGARLDKILRLSKAMFSRNSDDGLWKSVLSSPGYFIMTKDGTPLLAISSQNNAIQRDQLIVAIEKQWQRQASLADVEEQSIVLPDQTESRVYVSKVKPGIWQEQRLPQGVLRYLASSKQAASFAYLWVEKPYQTFIFAQSRQDIMRFLPRINAVITDLIEEKRATINYFTAQAELLPVEWNRYVPDLDRFWVIEDQKTNVIKLQLDRSSM